jgi:hypothetical protein
VPLGTMLMRNLLWLKALLVMAFLLYRLPVSAQGNFSTSFPASENPISQGGKWLNGATNGLDWNDVKTTRGFAGGVGPASVTFADPEAILNPGTTGPWGSDQQAQGTIYTRATIGNLYPEVELRLNSTMTAHNSTGYEFTCSVLNHPVPGMAIVRWNGSLANPTNSNNGFTILASVTTRSCADGDVIKATHIGGALSFYRNGILIVTASDSTYTNGAPGVGFDAGCDGTYANFGFVDFSAKNILSGPRTVSGEPKRSSTMLRYYFRNSVR